MTENGFAGIVGLLADDFTMDSPHGVEARQAHDKKGVEEWFGKMEEIWEGGLNFEPEEVIALHDEQVLAAVRTGGLGRATGIELDPSSLVKCVVSRTSARTPSMSPTCTASAHRSINVRICS
jgi:hypothetical protein